MIWFFPRHRYGHRVLGLLCRISLEPDSCVRRTQDVFARRGMQRNPNPSTNRMKSRKQDYA
jgi:hypothetical protein